MEKALGHLVLGAVLAWWETLMRFVLVTLHDSWR